MRVWLAVATALVAVIVSSGAIYAEEPTFDPGVAVRTQSGQAAADLDRSQAADDSAAALETEESPRDFLYAQYPNAAQIDCLISQESQWRDVPNAQGTGAVGYGQYMPSTWQRYQSESGRWDASPDNIYDVFDAIAWDLTRGRRGQWTVRGC